MRITFHGHRPSFLRTPTVDTPEPPTRPVGPDSEAGQAVRKINLGFFKIKIHRRTALQTWLMATVANRSAQTPTQATPAASRPAGAVSLNPPEAQNPTVELGPTAPPLPRTRQEYIAHWNAWARADDHVGREEAVRRLTDWWDHNLGRDADVAEALDLNGLGLTSLPYLPENVGTLSLDSNNLDHFPVKLPARLRYLSCRNAGIRSIPGNLPEGLRYLNLGSNFIDRLPERLPTSLETLDLAYNRLQDVPETFPSQMQAGSFVDLQRNPLTGQARARLSALNSDPRYQGPEILFSTHDNTVVRSQDPTLDEAVALWPQPPGADAEERTRTWQSFATEPGADAFAHFLYRLEGSVNIRSAQFQLSVGNWLSHLERRPQLRRQSFALSASATTSCEDRASLSFNAMRQLHLASDVARGDYDQRLPELLTLARGLFRLDQLQTIAAEKTALLLLAGEVDEVEVYLAYQVKLREALALPVDTPDMRHFNCSSLTEQDLTQATQRVNTVEREGFMHYLASDWQPWQSILQRLEPERYAHAQDELIEAMGDTFSNRLQARLKTVGLAHDPDAERLVGPQIRDEIKREINGRLTNDFMARHGLLPQT